MIYGLYLSSQGADQQSARIDVIANNLANASTNAFKRDFAVFQAHPVFDPDQADVPANLNESTGGVSLADVATDFSDGALQHTGRAFDVGLAGLGFFRLSDGQQEFLTRDGRLTVNQFDELTCHGTNLPVLSTDGSPIQIAPDLSQLEITPDGVLWGFSDEGDRLLLGQLDVVRPENLNQLNKVGDGLYRFEGELFPADGDVVVQQGFLESSGSRPVMEMLEMIEASRAFEANLNMIQFQDDALGRLLQGMARR